MLDTLMLLTASSGLVPCVVRRVRPGTLSEMRERAEAAGLHVGVLEHRDTITDGRLAARRSWKIHRTVALGSNLAVKRFVKADRDRDLATMADLTCQSLPAALDGTADPLWEMALASSGAKPVLDHSPSGVAVYRLNLPPNPLCNPFLRCVDLHLLSLPASRMDDAGATKLGGEILERGRQDGLKDDLELLLSLLSWPVQWTAVHGIAEIKTPVFKLVTNTLPIAEKLEISYLGTTTPEHAARGTTFSYLRPRAGLARGARILNRPSSSSSRDGT